ncbi:MAG: cysteine hydrolase [Chloroflexi bacterium]|nr:cysteine hydrolase [Chloroflexota bacterium]
MRKIQGKMVYETVEEIVQPKHAALLVIDVQNDNSSPRGSLASKGQDISWMTKTALPNIKLVLAEARRLGVMIIFTRTTKSPDGSIESAPMIRHMAKSPHSAGLLDYEVEGTWGHEVLDELEPRPNERQITKYRSSAFIGTPLDIVLKGRNIESAVVVGLVTQGCVMATTKDLLHYGYYPVLVSDGVASSRRDFHEAALVLMRHQYDVITTAELLKMWRSVAVTQ